MQTDWLIDFMTLAETRSFSRAAQLRHVTQPAFSRRIRSLETWAMTALVDRSRHPHTLTPAGELLKVKAPELVAAMQHTHALLRRHASLHRSILRFAAPLSLALHFFPDWIHGLDAALDGWTPQLATLEAGDAMTQLLQGECDLVLAYADADADVDPLEFNTTPCEVLRLGEERLLPCARPDVNGLARHGTPGTAHRPAPYLAFSERTVLGRVIDRSLQRQPAPPHLRRVFESDNGQSLMAMTLAGQGLAFLPERTVQAELARGRLVTAGAPLSAVLDICLVRRRPEDHGQAREPFVDAFWHGTVITSHAIAEAPAFAGDGGTLAPPRSGGTRLHG
jgi:DNA-binding transcriptional LysR family regulator